MRSHFRNRNLRGPSASAARSRAATSRRWGGERPRREARAECKAALAWPPHRPERPEKSEGGQRLVIKSDFKPQGDQPTAIKELVEGVQRHDRNQVQIGRAS